MYNFEYRPPDERGFLGPVKHKFTGTVEEFSEHLGCTFAEANDCLWGQGRGVAQHWRGDRLNPVVEVDQTNVVPFPVTGESTWFLTDGRELKHGTIEELMFQCLLTAGQVQGLVYGQTRQTKCGWRLSR